MKAAHAAGEHDPDLSTKMRWRRTMEGDRDLWKSGGEDGGVAYWISGSAVDHFNVLFADNGKFAAAVIVPTGVELKTKDAAKAFAAHHRIGLVKPMLKLEGDSE